MFTLPASTISTTSIVSRSVYRRPPTNFGSLPTLASISLISGPPPCTSTTLIPTVESSTMSSITADFSSSETMALPPYLMTTVLPAYCLM